MDSPKVSITDVDNNLSERLLDNVEQQQQPVELLPHADSIMAGPGEIVVDPLQAGHGLHGEAQSAEYRDKPFAL